MSFFAGEGFSDRETGRMRRLPATDTEGAFFFGVDDDTGILFCRAGALLRDTLGGVDTAESWFTVLKAKADGGADGRRA